MARRTPANGDILLSRNAAPPERSTIRRYRIEAGAILVADRL
jgi:hypothetical protein